MRIDRVHIDGFGRAVDSDIPLGPGLTLVRGRNGTGKTTLHQFLHAILFGFRKDVFPLVRGGSRGGDLHGRLEDGRVFTIRRHGHESTSGEQRLEVVLSGADGTDEQKRITITGGVTPGVFASLFAFGQDELHDLRRLTDEGVANRIYGASIGVIGDILKVEQGIAADLDRLWKVRGTNPAVNVRLAEINGLRAQLATRNLPAEYAGIAARAASVAAARARLDADLATLVHRRGDVNLQARSRAAWLAVAESRARLAGLPEEPPVSADDLAREAALAQVVAMEIASEQAERLRRTALDDELGAARYEGELIERASEVDEAYAQWQRWQERDRALLNDRTRMTSTKALVQAVLDEAGWDEAELAGMDATALRTEIATHARDDLVEPERVLALATSTRTRAEAEVRTRQAAADAGEAAVRVAGVAGQDADGAGRAAVDVVDPDELERCARALSVDIARAATLADAIAATPLSPMEERGTPVREPSGVPDAVAPTAGRGLVPAIAAGVAGLGIGGVLVVLGFTLVGLVVLGAGLALGVGMAVVGRRSSRDRGAPAAARAGGHPQAEELRALQVSIDARWSEVGLAGAPSEAGLEVLHARAAAGRATGEARRAAMRDAERAASDRSAAEAALSDALAREKMAATEVAAGLQRWKAFLAACGLPVGLDRDGAVDLVNRLDAVKSGQVDQSRLRTGVTSTERERRAWEARLRSLAGGVGVTVQPDDDQGTIVERLRQALAVARSGMRTQNDLVRQRDGALSAERAAIERLETARAVHAAFLADAGVADAIALAARYERTTKRVAAQAALAQAEQTFEGIVPPDRRIETEAALRGMDPDALTAAGLEIDREIERITAERDDLVRQESSLDTQAEALIGEADTSRLRQRLADAEGALGADARRWLVLRTAAELLVQTRAAYEAKHRPAVLSRAETLFVEWTGEEYSGFDRLAESGLVGVVSASDGKSVPLVGLSRGTAEQLYLAMRFALVEHLATQQEPLPLVMDDVLVNFDPERAERVARTIEQVATERQVIYLTCHAEVALRPTRTSSWVATSRWRASPSTRPCSTPGATRPVPRRSTRTRSPHRS